VDRGFCFFDISPRLSTLLCMARIALAPVGGGNIEAAVGKFLGKEHGLFATKLRNCLPQELVDLLQGRISQTVFMKFYYKPLLLDVQQKTIKAKLQTQSDLLLQSQ
jgi:hypothetical protein